VSGEGQLADPTPSWMATLKNDLALHNLTLEDAIELAVDKPLGNYWHLALQAVLRTDGVC